MSSEKIKTDYDDSNKELDDSDKELNDVINKIKNKKSRDLVNKKLNDIINNIGNRRLDSPDINFSRDFDSLRKTVDEINKDKSDQIDLDKLFAEITKSSLKIIRPTETDRF